MRGRCCPVLRAFWGVVDERDRFTWKQSDASLALCVVRVALSPSLRARVTYPEANSISVISGLPCLFKFNLNFEKEEKSKMKLGTNTVHKIVHQATQFIYTYTSRRSTSDLKEQHLCQQKKTPFSLWHAA